MFTLTLRACLLGTSNAIDDGTCERLRCPVLRRCCCAVAHLPLRAVPISANVVGRSCDAAAAAQALSASLNRHYYDHNQTLVNKVQVVYCPLMIVVVLKEGQGIHRNSGPLLDAHVILERTFAAPVPPLHILLTDRVHSLLAYAPRRMPMEAE